MSLIPASQARALFTQSLVDVYKEMPKVMSFLRSFFPTKEYGTKYLSIEVQRGFERIAVDVLRGTEGNRNTFSKSTQKIFEPGYYREFFDMTQLDMYDRLFTQTGSISEADLAGLVAAAAEHLFLLQSKIERSYELQCAQVLLSGIVQLVTSENIDYKRKAESLVDLSATPWTNGSNNPFTALEDGAKFIRTQGKSQGAIMNVIMGSLAHNAFMANTIVKERYNIWNFNLGAVVEPQRNAVGAAYHGRVSAGSYLFDVWTYPEFYTDSTDTAVPYVHEKKVVILPESPRFQLSFAAVPQLIDGAAQNIKGAYKVSEFRDERKATHEVDIQSAGLAIPVAVDQIYTAQVVA
jgi:Phage major capsid protein E